jgi:hypothetical protein
MVAQPVSEEEQRNNYRLNHVCQLGAQPLGVEGEGHTVWIRRRFALRDAGAQSREASDE